MKKKLIASAASLALFFTTAFCGLSAPVHAAEVDNTEPLKTVEEDIEFIRDSETGHIAIVNDDNGYVSSDNGKIKPNAALPSSYGSYTEIKNTYPNTRNQNPYGTCWAHAATATAEFDLVKNHGLNKSNADFSELQLAYLNYHTNKEMPGLDGDKVYIPSNAPKGYLDVGGNFYYSMHTLAQWKCFSYESNMKYSNVVSNKSYNPWYSISSWADNTYHNAAQLRNVRMLSIKNDPAAVKQAIMDYGAVYISYNHDSRYYSLNGYSLYYNPNKVNTNHDVVIVGWDDNIPRTSFPAGARPSSNGAWLVRNSWSTNQSAGSEHTYFYMSYDEASLNSTAYAVDFERYWEDDNIYQHDGSTTHTSVYTNSVANVFTASSSMDRNSEKLDSVMASFMFAENVNYKIEVYKNLTSSLPRSGKLAATVTGRTTAKGIYTIDLNTDIYLFPGERFSIVISTSDGTSKYFDVESSHEATYYQNGVQNAWFTTVASADKGESYIYKNGTWTDVTANGYGNVCIKAITSDNYTSKYNIYYTLNGGTNNASNPTEFYSYQSGSVNLYNPTRSGYHFTGWYTDSSLWYKITAVNYNNKYDQHLYAGWCSNYNSAYPVIYSTATTDRNGSYAMLCSGCNMIKSQGTSYMISSIALNKKSFGYDGNSKSPVPVVTTINGEVLQAGTDYTYSYDQTDRRKVGKYSVTINFINKYEGSKTLWFDIVQSGPATGSAKLYGYNDIKVSWSKVSGAAGYKVYYKKSSATTYKNYKSTKKLTLNFANLAGNTKYNFKIVPYFNDGRQAGSKIVSATTLKKLNQPSIKKAPNEYGRVSLNWQCITAASGYQVWWSKTKYGKYTKLCDFSNKYIGVTFTVGINQKYWYKTRAYRVVNGKRIYAPYSTPKAYTLK